MRKDSVRKPDSRSAHRAATKAGRGLARSSLCNASIGLARAKLGRSLSIRQVDAGSCNGCELEIHALNNAFYDLERFGLRFVASPRHADVLMVTGPVTKNMREALLRTYNATPDPKWVVAVGDCAIDGGVFAGSYAVVGARQRRHTGRLAHPRLSAIPGRTLERTHRVVGPCRRKARGPCKSRLMAIPTIISPNSASLLWDQPELHGRVPLCATMRDP